MIDVDFGVKNFFLQYIANKTDLKKFKKEKMKKPQCPFVMHNRVFGEEECHTHKNRIRQWLHEKHCKRLDCPHADRNYGKWGGKFDTRDKGWLE